MVGSGKSKEWKKWVFTNLSIYSFKKNDAQLKKNDKQPKKKNNHLNLLKNKNHVQEKKSCKKKEKNKVMDEAHMHFHFSIFVI